MNALSAERLEEFERRRPRLFGIAYRMLGSVEDAEDLVQETYLRWHQADREQVRSAEAWLVSVITRLSVDRLRRAATERAAYVGSWLPEPVATGPPPDRSAEVESDLSMAFLVLLERLGPEERAAFILHDVFDVDYDEIAHVLDRSEAACRQMVHRARARVRSERSRFAVSPEAKERLLERFLSAVSADDKDAMLALFAEDAEWVSDGGGKSPAVRKVLRGADRLVRLVLGYERKGRGVLTHRAAWVNGESAIVTSAGGHTIFVTLFRWEDERVAAVYRVLNPDKLHHLDAPVAVS